jgi:hypothetical protein
VSVAAFLDTQHLSSGPHELPLLRTRMAQVTATHFISVLDEVGAGIARSVQRLSYD